MRTKSKQTYGCAAAWTLASALAAGLVLAGCGGATFDSIAASDAGGDAPSASDGDSDSATHDGGPGDDGPVGDAPSDSPVTHGPCPASPPTPGSACTREDLQCEYGTSQYVGCDILVQCTSGQWQTQTFGDTCPGGPNPPECPPTMASVPSGSACGSQTITCHYDLGQCTCGFLFGPPPPPLDGGGPGYTWTCDDPGPGCPQPRPRVGSACTQDGQSCMYETCSYGQQCTGGVWQAEPVGCAQAGGQGQ